MSLDIISILNEVIDDDFKIPLNSNSQLRIDENKNIKCKDSLGQFVVFKKNCKTFTFSLDKDENENFRVFRFFDRSNKHDINKKNDAIIFSQNNKEIFAFIIELKSKNPKGAGKQLLSGKNFVNFIIETVKLNYDPNFTVHIRGLLFYTGRKGAKSKPTKRGSTIKYTDFMGLKMTIQDCNKPYHLTEFMCD